MTEYVASFLAAFLLSVIAVIASISIGKKIIWQGRTSGRHFQKSGAIRLGGAAIITAFIIAIILNKQIEITPELAGFLMASIFIMLVGLYDDIKEISWKTQFIYQIAASAVVFFAGIRIYYIANPFSGKIIMFDSALGATISFFLVVAWIVLMINSMNWLDGIDGLSGGVTFIGALTIFFLSLKAEVNQPSMAHMALILAGAALGFLIFNFNPARVLAGTSGSMFMGFSLAVMAIFAGTKIATSLLVMSIPFFDFLWVIGERWKNGKSIFHPDRNHLHYKLLDLGWSQRKTAAYCYSFTVLIAVVALNTRALGKGIAFLAIAAIMAVFLKIISRKADREIIISNSAKK